MTDTATRPVAMIRPYKPVDHAACRRLWVELTETRRRLYDDPTIGGRDPGAAFEDYLTRLDLSGMWVGDHPEEGVVGFVGLILDGRAGEVDPVIVAQAWRGLGVGRALLGRVADEARKRGMRSLSVSPAARNTAAIHSLHDAGYTALSHVTLTLDLSPQGHEWIDGIELHGQRFKF